VSQAPKGVVNEFMRRLQTGNAREILGWEARRWAATAGAIVRVETDL
jgi:hypothetical protein